MLGNAVCTHTESNLKLSAAILKPEYTIRIIKSSNNVEYSHTSRDSLDNSNRTFTFGERVCKFVWYFSSQNRVYTWFIGCMRFGVDSTDAVATAVVVVFVWFLVLRYNIHTVHIIIYFMKYHCEHPAELPQRFFPLNHISSSHPALHLYFHRPISLNK